ncbi:hypothetical protein NEOLEDRAFT_1139762 [Neolentinus lepideus HHB14362 ss-1]|uniref:Uncharacterized protein n=1 Tax=Neolentinus lepideus HHB14362 ss-1 TaxID=1314782 RepID=A0A165PJX3_9AGAM|nr:hypothetical protein NEOLEDRAFT_1139762 [Neolentinus lepideus HHB14362 ss-1]
MLPVHVLVVSIALLVHVLLSRVHIHPIDLNVAMMLIGDPFRSLDATLTSPLVNMGGSTDHWP